MKNFNLLIVVLFLQHFLHENTIAQDCNYDYIINSAHPFTVDSDIGYSNPDNPPLDWDCSDSTLEYDIYYPSDYNFNSKPALPAIFMLHGGGFHDGTDRSKLVEFCEEFASRNFIAVNIDYRTGLNDVDSCTAATKIFATYRAVQDARAAIRKVVADQVISSSLPYRIDTSELYIGGVSAGAIVALLVAYYDQKDMNKALPGVNACLGSINDASHYLPKKNKVPFKIKGVFSLSGAIFKTLNAIQKGDPPAILFHGEKDKLVPFHFENAPFCSTSDLLPLCKCAGFVMPPGDEPTFGPDSMVFRLQKLHICYEFYHDPDGGHTLTNSDYGLGIEDPDTAREYIVERVCCFFKSVKCGSCTSDPALVDFDDEVNNTCDGYQLKSLSSVSSSSAFYQCKWNSQSLQLSFNNPSTYTIAIRSIDGRYCFHDTGSGDTYQIDLAILIPGIYVVQIIQDGSMGSEKLLRIAP